MLCKFDKGNFRRVPNNMQLCKTQQEEKSTVGEIPALPMSMAEFLLPCMARRFCLHSDPPGNTVRYLHSHILCLQTELFAENNGAACNSYIFCNLCITKCTSCDSMVKPGFGYALICACSHQSEHLALEKNASGVLQTAAADI